MSKERQIAVLKGKYSSRWRLTDNYKRINEIILGTVSTMKKIKQ